uniref:Ovule protein n=1 Tax=Parascaris equorum TaxID=6256 RepID=A0A914R5S0_PAREQ
LHFRKESRQEHLPNRTRRKYVNELNVKSKFEIALSSSLLKRCFLTIYLSEFA